MPSNRQACLTGRQEKILNILIQEHIKSARPVSSKFLEKEYCLNVCPATIRIEMQKLTEAGFICQPHTSAGRIPTDQGYRFFVDNLLKESFLAKNLDPEIKGWLDQKTTNSIKFLQLITKNLALISSNLVLGYLFDEKILWKDGWEEIIKDPEFSERKKIDDFFEMIDDFEKELDFFIERCQEEEKPFSEIKIYIGKENPFSKIKEFSTIIVDCHFPDQETGLLALFGPKRMDYDKNISLLNSLNKLLR